MKCANLHNLKIQDGGGRHLEFRKIVNNFILEKDICIKLGRMMHQGHDQKLKPEVNSRDVIK